LALISSARLNSFSAAFQSQLQAIARKDGSEVSDDVQFVYQTEKWGAPAKFVVEEVGHTRDVRHIEARLLVRRACNAWTRATPGASMWRAMDNRSRISES
jgi:hypothetical protein